MRKPLTAAALLLRQGYQVGGATMLLRPGGEGEAADAAAAARRLGINTDTLYG